MKPALIFLCDKTGNMARPWAFAGFECYCIDVQHSIRSDKFEYANGKDASQGSITFAWGDVRSWSPPPFCERTHRARMCVPTMH